jgi:DNA invertase Pin-like site-specific DNA recombinase
MKNNKIIDDIQIENIKKLYETMSIDKIARHVNISRHTINRILKESGANLRSIGARKGHYKGEKI